MGDAVRALNGRYGDYKMPDFAIKVIDKIPLFEVRHDDVFITGFPKSGTTWLQELLFLIIHDAQLDKAQSRVEERAPFLEFMFPGIEVIEKMPSPRVIKTHLAFSILPDTYKTSKPKTIYVARNPKDVMVSLYFYLTKFFTKQKVDVSFEDYCQQFIDGEVVYGPWWKHVKEGWERRNDDNVLYITYEELVMDLSGSIKNMSSFLGKNLSDEDIERIASYCSFDKMKTNNFVNKEWYKDCGMANKDAYFLRKGKIGDWRNHITNDMASKIDQQFESYLEPLGVMFTDPLDCDTDKQGERDDQVDKVDNN